MPIAAVADPQSFPRKEQRFVGRDNLPNVKQFMLACRLGGYQPVQLFGIGSDKPAGSLLD
jgi:hypothetical protein